MAGHALLNWLTEVVTDEVAELRVQTGYFRHDAVRSIAAFLQRAITADLRTLFVIGANEGDTTFDEASALFQSLGIPRQSACMGVVSYSAGLFHPKTYHVKRLDGSQAAFVGSANFTVPGVTSGNIEAGVALDTREGDIEDTLSEIAAATDAWFELPLRDGIAVVNSVATLEHLRDSGVLSNARPVRAAVTQQGRSGISAQPSLRAALSLPAWPTSFASSASRPSAIARPLFQTFGMTLQNTDVGHGQTTEGKQARSPEVFIPIKALDGNPSFWGWIDRVTPDNTKYAVDTNWAAAHAAWISAQEKMNRRVRRPLNKLDWKNVKLQFVGGGDVITATIWFNPDKKDIRIRNSSLRDAGEVMDVLLIHKVPQGEMCDYRVEIVKQVDPRYKALLAKLTTSINNSPKKIGYF